MDDDEHTTLGRIDERVKNLHAIVLRLEKEFVTLTRYLPVERLVFGLVALVLAATFVAMLALVIRK